MYEEYEEQLTNKLNELVEHIGKLIEIFKKEIKEPLPEVIKESLPEIQQDYDDILDFLDKTIIMSKEESEKLYKGIEKYESTIENYKVQINSYEAQKKIFNETIKELKEQISNKGVLEEQYNKLNNDYNILKQKLSKGDKDIYDYQIKIKNNENLIKELQNEINKVKKEIFEKKEKNANLEEELKQKIEKINEKEKKVKKLSEEINDISNSNVELRNKNDEQQKSYESKIKILEKQLKHLSDANNNFVQENNEVQTQLKDFQIYTNMAKVNTKKLNKEDFSILEVMSKRAETAELEVQKLLSYTEELKSLNKQIRDKIKPLEDYALLQIKHDHEINISDNTIIDIQNKIFTDEQKREIFKLKNDPNELFQALIKLKTENLELHKHVKDITIECNQQLREARWKTKKEI